MFYRQPGIAHPKSPPVLLMPGSVPTGSGTPIDADSSSEEIPVSPKRCFPAYMGTTFTFVCQLWRIVHGFTLTHNDKRDKVKEQSELDFAEMKYRELLAWIRNMPVEMARGEGNPHHVVVIQYVLFQLSLSLLPWW